jgi:hypothetical protein
LGRYYNRRKSGKIVAAFHGETSPCILKQTFLTFPIIGTLDEKKDLRTILM